MNLHKTIILIFNLFLYCSCTSQLEQNKYVSIKIPTIEQEATSIWRTINDIVFLEKQGYKINLPKNDLIQSLIKKSKNGEFGNDNFTEIYNLLETNVYKKTTYEITLKKVQSQEQLINKIVDQLQLSKKNWNWEFKSFENYDIVFTLYGTGGSYDPDLGVVTLFTTIDGKFMNYEKPAYTVIHEIIHMGIEKSIVQKYKLPHDLKERIVDLITYTMFNEFLPNYRIQNMGDTKIDKFFKNKKDIKNLDSIVKNYTVKN